MNDDKKEVECLVCNALIEIPSEIDDYEIVECYTCSEPFEYVEGGLVKMED